MQEKKMKINEKSKKSAKIKKTWSKFMTFLAIGTPIFVLVVAIFLMQIDDDSIATLPTDARGYKQQGDRAFQQRQYNKAIEYFEKSYEIMLAETEEKENLHVVKRYKAQIANNLANAYKRIGNNTMAEQWFQKGLAADKDHVESLYNYANLLARMNKNSASEGLYRRAIKNRPNFALALMGLANALRQRGELVESKELLIKANKLNPDEPDIMANLGLQYLGDRDLENGAMYLKKAADKGHEGARLQLENLMLATNRMKSQLGVETEQTSNKDTIAL